MKKLILSLIVMTSLMLMMVGGVSANTFPSDYESSLIAVADRLVEMQNPDGGFAWKVDPGATTGPGGSGINTLGITAMGILQAHELLDKAEYETALAKAYKFATENTAYYAFPDITFLTWLADACVEDASLLAAINTEVPETTIQDIRILAESMWTTRLANGRYGNDPRNFTATQMAEYLFSARGSLGFWDNEAAVKAALALGLDADAQDIADVMYAHLVTLDTFDIEDTTEVYYALALGGAIGGFSELGVYPTITRTMTDLLIINQYGAGYWDQGGDVTSDKESVQTTTYAVMALIAQGDEDALAAARQGGDWLISTQNPNGGWYPGYVDATKENLEVDSEAAWAIYETIQILDGEDRCPGTIADSPEKLGTNRWIWNGTAWETKLPKGEGPQKSFTMEDTQGCSCKQILEKMDGKMSGHWKFGCSISVMEDFIAGIQPILVDTVQVYAVDASPTSSNIVLKSGVEYELEVIGTAFAGDTIDFDAKYSITNRILEDTWTDTVSGYESHGASLLDLKVNDEFVDWGAYNSEHTYYWTLTGTGTPIELLIYDIHYPNNVGFITVNIFERQ